MLGDLVNVVARHLREHTRNYVQEIRGPALKLLGLYGIQVSIQEINVLSSCMAYYARTTVRYIQPFAFLLSNVDILLI